MTELKDTDVATEPCRLAFPALFEPKPVMKGSDDLKFQAAILIPPEVSLEPFQRAILAAASEQWGSKLPKLTGRANPLNSCTGKQLAGYEDGWHYVNTKSQYAPDVVDQQREPILDRNGVGDLKAAIAQAESRIFGGCWCRFLIRAYAWDNQFGKGVSFSLNAVQLYREDEAFAGRIRAADVFGAVQVADAPASQNGTAGGSIADLLG